MDDLVSTVRGAVWTAAPHGGARWVVVGYAAPLAASSTLMGAAQIGRGRADKSSRAFGYAVLAGSIPLKELPIVRQVAWFCRECQWRSGDQAPVRQSALHSHDYLVLLVDRRACWQKLPGL
eukprot:COSAG02_NODE_467_length_21771_cov_39.020303_1_plen_121_part_00